jgi:hypothetical protein
MTMRRALGLGAAALALAGAVPAAAVQQVTHDSAGRPITFDVQAQAADVAGYTAVLNGLQHGAEIGDVVVTIVPQSSIATECGSGAVACYRWSSRGGAVMFVPNLPPAQVRGSLAHEYGHHVDATRPHLQGAKGLDGTAGWWQARGMAALLAQGRVAWDYSLGWDHSIAEIFAEDYKLTNISGETSPIRWLGAPSAAVSDAIRADLAGATVSPVPPGQAPLPPPAATGPAPPSEPARTRAGARKVIRSSGRLAPGRRSRVRFSVTSPRRVAVHVKGVTRGRVRAVLRCNEKPVGGAAARRGRPATVRAARVAPGACRVTLRAVGAATSYRVTVVTTRLPSEIGTPDIRPS